MSEKSPLVHTSSRTQHPEIVIAAHPGAMTSLGNTQDTEKGLLEGRSGIREFDPTEIANMQLQAQVAGMEEQTLLEIAWKSGVGALVSPEDENLFEYPKSLQPPRGSKPARAGRSIRYAYAAARQALAILPPELFDPEGYIHPEYQDNTMIDVGMGAGVDIENLEGAYLELLTGADKGKVQGRYAIPTFMTGTLANLAAGHIANEFGIRGGTQSTNAACASSGHAMKNLHNSLLTGEAQIGVVVGSDAAARTVTGVVSFDSLMGPRRQGALSRNWRDHGGATKALRAFDESRDGFVPGDGAAAFVMMKRELADTVPVEYQAIVRSIVRNTCNPQRDGGSLTGGTIQGQTNCLRQAVEQARLSATNFTGRLNFIVHGTGTQLGAENEIAGIRENFADFLNDEKIIITGNKEQLGHTLGGAFALNVFQALMAMKKEQCSGLPATRNIDPKFVDVAQAIAQQSFCVSGEDMYGVAAYGFGGVNAVAILEPAH